jgi:hypothetical protein
MIVAGSEGDYVIGKNLVLRSDEFQIVLSAGQEGRAAAWLKEREWETKPGFKTAWKRIKMALAALRDGAEITDR